MDTMRKIMPLGKLMGNNSAVATGIGFFWLCIIPFPSFPLSLLSSTHTVDKEQRLQVT